ncbi:MAG: imelysin family protein [Sulfurimonas sp.]|nr:imelysin family protein [Sulfurimonas sp.]
MKNRTRSLLTTLSLAAVMSLSPCMAQETKENNSILTTYANIANANYNDALSGAKELKTAVDTFAKNPSDESMKKAKEAWLSARESYGQTEIFRLAHGPIDAEDGWVAKSYGAPEGQLNAWPLDENMIDYTIDANGKRTSGNIIDTKGLFNPGGENAKAVDVTTITPTAIAELNENGGDANVATGYHAVEFLLWGQDQDYASFVKDSITKGAMTAGQRALSDFTTDKDAPRRVAYLQAATDKIVEDLTAVNSAWSKTISKDCATDATGCYRAAFLGELTGADSSKNIAPNEAKKGILAAMGVFIKSELANERVAVAVLTPSEEDEHSCFSDNTHRDIYANYQGFKNVLTGSYNNTLYGKSPLQSMSKTAQSEMTLLMSNIEMKIASINEIAKTSRHFDHQIQPNDPQAKVIVKLKNELRKLGDKMVDVASANGVKLTVEDVTDAEETKL